MKRIERTVLALGVLAAVCASAPAAAQGSTAGRDLAANCANCHGTDGKARSGATVLAGLPKDRIVTTMRLFRDGQKSATIMHQIAKGYTPTQVELIADYFAAVK